MHVARHALRARQSLDKYLRTLPAFSKRAQASQGTAEMATAFLKMSHILIFASMAALNASSLAACLQGPDGRGGGKSVVACRPGGIHAVFTLTKRTTFIWKCWHSAFVLFLFK